ncbi:MAG: response regulator [Candidatus Poribacteria bacterium]|nr:response regulator [Candidatus Poribacteria bacterium]MDE0506337.1 response regulator [Candidatus Poribacteria bacterium]
MSTRAAPKILVVDDDGINIKILQIQLEAQGYVVLTATSGGEALELIASTPPDLVLLDIQMPRMDGFEVCRQIRAEESTQFVPVVMVTALKDAADRIQSIQAGADDFISKPFDGHEIVARVGSLLRIKEYRDELEEHNARLQAELEMARQVQEILMPQNGIVDLAGFEIVSHSTPEIEVGGDFFDFWEIQPGRVGLFISDVMGHGVSAALVAVFMKTVVGEIRDLLGNDPGQLLTALNARFSNTISSQMFMFATAFYAVMDLSNASISCANAGHPHPFLIHRHRRTCEFLSQGIVGKGLGLLADSVYETANYDFDHCSRMLLYTDGAYEARNPEKEEFGVRRLEQAAVQQTEESGAALVSRLRDSIDKFRNGIPTDDDLTFVAVDVAEPENSTGSTN